MIVLALVVWLVELVWLYKMTEDERGDPVMVVSGSAPFFVGAIPIAVLAPSVVDGVGSVIEKVVNGTVGRIGRGSSGQQTAAVPLSSESDARLLIDGQETPITLPRTRMGRYPNNEIVIDNSTVSAYHAEIIRRPDGRHEVIDRESRNGTRVNGALIRTQVLKDGDLITLGGATLHYLNAPRYEAPVADYPPQAAEPPSTPHQF